MENNLFEQAKDAITNLMNMQREPNQDEQQAAQSAIQAAYENATPEEIEQLQHLEQRLKEQNHLQ